MIGLIRLKELMLIKAKSQAVVLFAVILNF